MKRIACIMFLILFFPGQAFALAIGPEERMKATANGVGKISLPNLLEALINRYGAYKLLTYGLKKYNIEEYLDSPYASLLYFLKNKNNFTLTPLYFEVKLKFGETFNVAMDKLYEYCNEKEKKKVVRQIIIKFFDFFEKDLDNLYVNNDDDLIIIDHLVDQKNRKRLEDIIKKRVEFFEKEKELLAFLETLNLGDDAKRLFAPEYNKRYTNYTKLEQLRNLIKISRCFLKSPFVVIIARLLGEDDSLTKIDFEDEGIGDKGAQALAKALKNNTSVTDINLSVVRFG